MGDVTDHPQGFGPHPGTGGGTGHMAAGGSIQRDAAGLLRAAVGLSQGMNPPRLDVTRDLLMDSVSADFAFTDWLP